MIKQEEGGKRLLKNLTDQIKEQQAKLGYRKESVSLYYPLETLNHFFQSEQNAATMEETLQKFVQNREGAYAGIGISRKGQRFRITVPEDMSEEIHKNTKEDDFIHRLVKLVGGHGASMQEIQDLFRDAAGTGGIEEAVLDDDEFDRMLRFTNDPDDTYYYCFKDEGIHITYHRFLPEDYRELFGEEA